MASVNISITEEAYRYLRMLKGKEKSFSDVVLEMKQGNRKGTGKDILKFAGVLKDVSWDERERKMNEFRHDFNKRIERTARYMREGRKK